MFTMLATTGDGDAVVTATYTVDADGDAEITAVHMQGVDITAALTGDQIKALADKALKDYHRDCDLIAAELAIERMEG